MSMRLDKKEVKIKEGALVAVKEIVKVYLIEIGYECIVVSIICK